MYAIFRDTLHSCENSPPTESPPSWETPALATVATLWALNVWCESTRATMTQDTSNRNFNISELTRLIASQLVFINISLKSVMNLACARRYLEEPVLRHNRRCVPS